MCSNLDLNKLDKNSALFVLLCYCPAGSVSIDGAVDNIAGSPALPGNPLLAGSCLPSASLLNIPQWFAVNLEVSVLNSLYLGQVMPL